MAWREARGADYFRTGIALAAGHGHIADAIDFAQRAWGRSSVPALALRAIAGGVTPGSPAWGSELEGFNTSAAEAWELVLEASIPGKLGCRAVPLAVPLISPDGGTSASWVAEHTRKPATDMDFSVSRLDARKIAGIVVMSEELVRLSSPSAEPLLRVDLTRAMAARLDASFMDPSNSGTAGEEPASVTSGAATVAATGDMRADLRALVAAFQGDLTRASFVARPELYAQMAGADYPDVGIGDGQLLQRPAIASRNIPASGSSPDTFDLALIDGSGVAIGQGPAVIDAARHAAIDVDGNGTLIDLWSRNLVGIRGEQTVDWEVQRAGAVALLTSIPVGAS